MALTNKQQAFVSAYLKHFNGTRAAIEAGYAARSAQTQASDLLKHPMISEAIRAYMRAGAMEAEQVIFHLREIAVGLRDDEFDSNGKPDLVKIKDAGKSHLIRGIRDKNIVTEQSESFETEIELVTPAERIKALELIGKNLKIFSDRTEITGKDGAPIEVRKTLLSELSDDDLDNIIAGKNPAS